MNYTDILRAFGFEIEADATPHSIYDYAPVFRVSNSDGSWIVKRTQPPLARAQAIVAWTQSLAALGISVVNPAPGFGENPRAFLNKDGKEQPWVVYPFIDGQPYEGDRTQIRAAGELLGRIHAAGSDQDFGLKQRETVIIIEAEEVGGDIERVLGFMQQAFPHLVDEASVHLQQQAQHYFQHTAPRMTSAALPVTNCSWDYKASNLIFQPTGPVLI
ncbi:MAG TPA: phosphotransferase, partial [Anaerolineales bacterium]|nr:phosphotransferase [Anaerolineales bacterium]